MLITASGILRLGVLVSAARAAELSKATTNTEPAATPWNIPLIDEAFKAELGTQVKTRVQCDGKGDQRNDRDGHESQYDGCANRRVEPPVGQRCRYGDCECARDCDRPRGEP